MYNLHEYIFALDHLHKNPKHKMWVDLEYGNMWCATCQDYVYDSELKVQTIDIRQ